MANKMLRRLAIIMMAFAMIAVTVQSTAHAAAPTVNSETAAQTSGEVFATAFTDMNIRGGPGTNYERLGTLRNGESVRLDGRYGGWFRFSYVNSNVKGWLSGTLVRITGDMNSLPIVTFPPEGVEGVQAILDSTGSTASAGQTGATNNGTQFVTPPEGSVIATAAIDMNIRGGPGKQYEIQGKLFKGQSLILDGRYGGWFRFSYRDSNVKGWLSGTLIQITGDLNKLPVVTFPPSS
jgi:uncharacterized protein YraI